MKSVEKELEIEHVFDAPVASVFEAWTDPDKLKQWYAPDGCTIEYKFIEVKEGGRFHYRIQHPVHGAGWVIGRYLEIVPPSKIVFTISLSNESGGLAENKPASWPDEILTTVSFEPFGNKTKSIIHEAVSDAEARKTGAYQGWIEMFNKLNQQLTSGY